MSFVQHLNTALDRRVLLVIVSLLAVLWVQAPRLTDEFRVDRDFRTFYWMNKFQSPELFMHGRLPKSRGYEDVHLFGRNLTLYFHSPGYGLLFYVASFFTPPPFFSKLLPFLVIPITVWYMFELGQSARDRGTGAALAVGFIILNLASSSSLSVITGLQRSFSIALLVIIIYYLHRRKYGLAMVAAVVCASIYAPVLLLALVTWGLFITTISWQPRVQVSIDSRGFGFLLLAFVCGCLILAPAIFPHFGSAFIEKPQAQVGGQVVNLPGAAAGALLDNPRHQAGGKAPIFYFFPFVGRGGLVEDSEEVINFLILLVLSGLIYLAVGRRSFNLPRVIWCVLGAGFGMFILAWVGIWFTNSFVLYMPNRYTRVALFLFLLTYVVFNGRQALRAGPELIHRNPGRLIWLVAGIELLIVGLLLFYPSDRSTIESFNMKWLLAPAGFLLGFLGFRVKQRQPSFTLSLPGLWQTSAGRIFIGIVVGCCLIGWGAYTRVVSSVGIVDPPQIERELLAFLKTLPDDSLLAGTPCTLDDAPLYANKSVLFSCFYSNEQAPVGTGLAAYYSDERQEVVNFCQTYGIDYLVVDLDTYSSEYLARGQIFFEPYNQDLLSRIVDQKTFFLPEVPDEIKVFQSQHLFVVPCAAL